MLKQLGIYPKRTVRFTAWMDEEQGAEGALTYAGARKGSSDHVAALECDSGAGHPVGFHFVGKPDLEERMRPLAQVFESIGASTVTPPAKLERMSTPQRQRRPWIQSTQDSHFYFNYHHTAADTFDKVDARELYENAAVMAVLAFALADSADTAPN